ncbi:MaoC/PaaZ C-terminal domain-containing protein [Acidovorax sp. Root219]|uniref:MaoC/PaaZ C-terminal domain-containing protein n=1 Tax=Acidovorax sp. Root219 TaxID=1736493 RepID=UPI000708D80A|nr:MaoC/PaaZ C-terminal domain-containing protein [Acidovorax sp. Root219]KRC26387.1 hypothetical protein ASE28_22145 [Acidovorax sp. Root219]
MTDTIAATQPLYLEDMTVGRRFTSGEHAMDAEQIVSFARQFDPQPFHLDDAAAKGTLFGETLNQHGDVLQVSTVRIVVPRKPGAAP